MTIRASGSDNMDSENKFELPYKVMEIDSGDECLILSFIRFKRHQDSYSIKRGGVLGDFEVSYKCRGIESRFECELTPGNLNCFYYELENLYDGLPGTKPTAVLENNTGEAERTKITFTLNKGRCFISGSVRNKNNDYKSGIFFDIDTDGIILSEILTELNNFLDEIIKIQGHRNFF